MRKLAKGHRRVRLLVENDPPGCGHWHSEIFIQWSVSDSEVRGWWHEDKAPPECFAEEPPPPPLVVDDVVMPEGVPAGCHNGDIGVVTREERAGVCHVKFNSREEVAFACLKLTRIGHLDRTK